MSNSAADIKNEIERERIKISQLINEINVTIPNLSMAAHEQFAAIDRCSEVIINEAGNAEATTPHDLTSILEMLGEETVALCSDIEKWNMEAEKENDEKKRILKAIDDMGKIKKSASVEKPLDKGNIEVIESNLKRRFREEKVRLKEVLECILPENTSTRNLLANIVNHYFSKGSSKYYDIEPSDQEDESVAVLLRSHIFELNPENSHQIRLIDMNCS